MKLGKSLFVACLFLICFRMADFFKFYMPMRIFVILKKEREEKYWRNIFD